MVIYKDKILKIKTKNKKMVNIKDQNFADFSRQVVSEVALQLSKNRLNIAETLALLKMLGVAENLEQLKRLIILLVDRFPLLKMFIEREEEGKKVEIEGQLQLILSKMLKEDPLLAAKISEQVIKEHQTLESLVLTYPQIKKYI